MTQPNTPLPGQQPLDPWQQPGYNPITGLLEITGEPDSGKTSFALANCAPEKMYFIDADLKGKSTIDEFRAAAGNFPNYVDVVSGAEGMTEIKYHQYILNVLSKIPDGLDRIIFDNWTRFEDTFKPWVTKHPSQFRDSYAPMGSIKGAQQWVASFEYEQSIFAQLLKKAKLVIITVHLKDERMELTEGQSVKTGKQIPSHKRPLLQQSRWRLWLRHNPDGTGIPVGIVLKRLSKMELVGGVLKPINVLPRKLTPCTWEKVFDYWKNPVGDRLPRPEEMPDEFEQSILSGALTKDQQQTLRVALKAMEVELAEAKSGSLLPPPVEADSSITSNAIKAAEAKLTAAGQPLTPANIAAELGVEVPVYFASLNAESGE